MEERFLLGRVALQRRDISGRRVQRPFLIEANLTDPAAVGLYEAAMSTGEAADRPTFQFFDQLRFAHAGVQGLR